MGIVERYFIVPAATICFVLIGLGFCPSIRCRTAGGRTRLEGRLLLRRGRAGARTSTGRPIPSPLLRKQVLRIHVTVGHRTGGARHTLIVG
jgi:hypothetical protein